MNDVEWMARKLHCSAAQSKAMGLRITRDAYGVWRDSKAKIYGLTGSGIIFPGAVLLIGKTGCGYIDQDIADVVGVDIHLFCEFKEGLFGRQSTSQHGDKINACALGLHFRREYLL